MSEPSKIPDDLHIFAIHAHHLSKGRYNSPLVVRAESVEEAVGLALAVALQIFPKAKGYSGHDLNRMTNNLIVAKGDVTTLKGFEPHGI